MIEASGMGTFRHLCVDENGARCISLVLVEVETDKEEFGGFVFRKKMGGAQ